LIRDRGLIVGNLAPAGHTPQGGSMQETLDLLVIVNLLQKMILLLKMLMATGPILPKIKILRKVAVKYLDADDRLDMLKKNLHLYIDEMCNFAVGCSIYRKMRAAMRNFKKYGTSLSVELFKSNSYTGILLKQDTFFGEVQLKRVPPAYSRAKKYVLEARTILCQRGLIENNDIIDKKIYELSKKRVSVVNTQKMFAEYSHPHISKIIEEYTQLFKREIGFKRGDNKDLYDFLLIQFFLKTFFESNRAYCNSYRNVSNIIVNISEYGVFDHDSYKGVLCNFEIKSRNAVNEIKDLLQSVLEIYGVDAHSIMLSEIERLSFAERESNDTYYRVIANIDDIDYGETNIGEDGE
jgi:hypothetical protein